MKRWETNRETIVLVAKHAIADARDREEVSTVTVRRLMKVARTFSQFAVGDWRLGKCGCLVGSLYGEGVDVDGLDEGEYQVGLFFDSHLKVAVGASTEAVGIVTVRP